MRQKIRRRKSGVSAVIGTVIMFSILFTVGFGYFYSITQGQQIYQKTVQSVNSGVIQESEESLVLTPSVANNVLQIAVNNTGITATIDGYWIVNSTLTQYLNGSKSTPALPYVVGQGKSVVLSGGKYNQGSQYLIKVLTARGNVFTAIYPPTAVSLASQAISSGALGDLYLSFNSYTYFTVGRPSGCPSTGQFSGYCLTKVGPAFTIPYSTYGSDWIAFAVTITNLNTQHASIILDQFSLIYQVFPHAESGFFSQPWYVISNETDALNSGLNAIYSEYSPIVLNYDVSQTVVFASNSCIQSALNNINEANCVTFTSGNSFDSPSHATSGFGATVYIMSHGWELTSFNLNQLSYNTANYGQNLPYVSTVYT